MLELKNAEVYRAALDTLQTGVCVVDCDRKISFWNEGAEKITGYLRQEVVGRFCGEILMVKYHKSKGALCERACPLVSAMRDGRPRESRVYLHHKSGYAIPVCLRAVPIRDAHGHIIGATESFMERPWMSVRRRPGANLLVGHGLDALTHLPDFAFTESYLAERLKFAADHVIPFGLLRVQLDQFAPLRATHGLEAAEAILYVIAHTLRNGLDPQDFVGRWSEDQFLAIVAIRSSSDLLSAAERLKRLAESSEIVWWGDHLSVTVSVGGTILTPGEAADAILLRTGNALLEAIAQGGNAVVLQDLPETP